jgi:hypothetical protein
MSCPKTGHLLTEYFDDSLSPVARAEIERHLQGCEYCAHELEGLLAVQNTLHDWHDERVPHWDRGAAQFRSAHKQESAWSAGWAWRWLPTAASFVMFTLLAFNTSVSSNDSGFTVSFGSPGAVYDEARLEQQLVSFAAAQQQQQEQDLQLLMARVAERLDSNNLRLMQAVMEQARELTADNFEQIYTYFEQQRQLDMETVQVSYQQLMDSDFETLRTMEQLANYVQFRGELR